MSSFMFNDKSISTTEKFRSSAGDSPNHTLEFNEKIVNIEFSPYLWSHDLICIAFPTKIVIGQIRFQEEDDNQLEEISYNKIEEFATDSRVMAMSWSPETNIKTAPKNLVIAISNVHFAIVVYGSYLTKDADSICEKIIEGHTSYINDISYDPTGDFLASVSDDLSCRIWLASDCYDPLCRFNLRSPGMAVNWHKDEPGKLLVGEKFGTITLYNVTTRMTILSVRSQGTPLMSMDWSLTHNAYIAALCGGNLVVWCLTNPSAPQIERMAHLEGGLKIKFFPLSEHKLVTLGAQDNTIKVYQTSPPSPYPTCLTTSLKMPCGLTCHQNLPYVCTGMDNFICIWKLSV